MTVASSYVLGFRTVRAPEGAIEVRSPADVADRIGTFEFARREVDDAVGAAHGAGASWRRLSVSARAEFLRRYQARLRANVEVLCRTIAREIGKPMWEARAEVQSMIGKIDLTLGPGAAYTEGEAIPEVHGQIRYRPHGVMAVIGPFNFPGHLPNGQITPALLLGNTVVFKPSEKSPQTALEIARCFEEAGLPEGVFSVVQGDATVADHLSRHDGIDGIFFTGSIAVGKKILAANAHRPGLMVALELGGKNAAIVLDDCDLERAVREIAFAGFATAGQRCTATSRVFVTRGVAGPFIDRLADAAARCKVGWIFEEDVFSGPMISEAARGSLAIAQKTAREAGFEARAAGGNFEVAGHEGYYVRPAVHVAPRAEIEVAGYTDQELFGPDVAVHIVADTDEALAIASRARFGLSASVFTASEAAFEACADALRVGVLHWNKSSAGASGRLPFGGVGESGNHRPAGIFAGLQCVYPEAILRGGQGDLPSWPGLSFDR